MDTSDIVSSYSESLLLHPLGSARAVQANSSILHPSGHCPSEFSVIIDSGATAMMVPFHHCFITYKPTPKSYVILGNSQKSPCLGRGDVCITMGGFTVVLKDVLHIPSLRCPLFSIRCHQ
jgi:hypothetical protein